VRAQYKDLFGDEKRQHRIPRASGSPELASGFRYLEVFKFPQAVKFSEHGRLQVYLPWVDDCPTKGDLRFERDVKQEVRWDYPLRAWVSVGAQIMSGVRENGWGSIRPSPSAYGRLAYPWWNHHGFTLELHGASVKGVREGRTVVGFLGRASYGYSIWLLRPLTLVLETGYRGVHGGGGLSLPGWGLGANLAWEVPGTRHHETGQRMILEAGCDAERHYGTVFINGHDMRGWWSNCKFGIGLGW
jgi:hypothetical protein